MAGAPSTGILTFLFTDIEGSTRRWVEHGDAMAAAVAHHDEIIETSVATHDGHVFATGGDGFAVAFPNATDAARAAGDIVTAIGAANFDRVGGLAVRIGVHTGPAERRGDDYFGPEVARAARIGAAGHGGQILLSHVTAALIEAPTRDLGKYRLRDFPDPESLHQLDVSGERVDFPPLRSLEEHRTTLPSPRSTFFGRSEEIERVRRRLHDHRLVTLTGVGGTGKTRLAVEAAWEELPDRDDGAFFADLTSATDVDQLLAAVVAGTIERADGQDPRSQLLARLAPLDAVLVIDNCEHLLDESAELVEDLLDACTDLRIVATSREPLDVEGEQVIRIPSLASSQDDVAPGPATRLFFDRARAVDGDLDLSEHADVVARICDRLDGIPLAIELAAARTRVLTPAEVLDRLDDRFSLLTGSRRRRGHQRQKTLEAAVAWSYDLLDVDERQVFRSLAVLERGFDLRAAAAVADLDEGVALDVLDSLVAKSLVVHDPETGRFSLLETLRQYAEERLVEAGEADAARRRQMDHYRSLVRREPGWLEAGGLLEDHEVVAVVQLVGRERANLVTAFEWALECGDDRALLDLAVGCGRELTYGHLANIRFLDVAIERAERIGADPAELAYLLMHRLAPSILQLDVATWRRCATRVQELLTTDHPVLVQAISAHGFLRMADAPEITVQRCLRAEEMADRLGLEAFERGPIDSHMAAGLAGLRRYDEALVRWSAQRVSRTIEFLSDGWVSLSTGALLHVVGRSAEAVETFEAVQLRTDLWREPIAGLRSVVLVGAGRRDEAIELLVETSTRPRVTGLALVTDNLALGFAAVRADRGEHERAIQLTGACVGIRTPMSLAVLVELVASLEGWPDDEFHERRRELVLRRFEPGWMEHAEERRAELLAEETEFFATG